MANLDVRTPRFYVDYINYLISRGVNTNNFTVSTGDASNIDVATNGGSAAELFDMRPLNQVEFNTTSDPDGHVSVVLDLNTSSLRVDFVAILNHNMLAADAKVRISSSETKSEVEAIDHAGADDTEANNVLVNVLGTKTISNNKATVDDTYSWGAGHTIVTFPQNKEADSTLADRYWGIQFEGTNSQTSVGHGDGTFDTSTNLKIGCILLGQFYDMPQAPDIQIKRSIIFDGVDVRQSLGGSRFSNLNNHGRRALTNSNKSPFMTYFDSFGAYGGRMVYDMNFSYLNSSQIMPTSYDTPQTSQDAVIEDLWNKTNGNHIPFIFTQDNTSTAYSDYLFARFGQNNLDMTQVADKVYNIKFRIEEEF